MKLRDYTFLGTTQSLCPECLTLVPAKIIARDQRVYFRKRCPTHGQRDDFVCSDRRWYDRMEFSLPGKVPPRFGIEPQRGCPFDCGLCSEHEQHTCVGLLEITSSCNLTCPMCYASSAPGGRHLSLDDCRRAIDALVEAEGRPEVLQLSGGEPTIHPDFLDVFRYACRQPIDIVMINTNGVRLARDADFLAQVAELKHRSEIYLQFDGLDDDSYVALRGEPLLDIKLRAVDALGRAGMRVILVCTVQAGVNENELGRIVEFGLARPWITGVSFQPATYSGRYVLPDELERRVTFPDVIRAVVDQTQGSWQQRDFLPLPCAHPNGHSLAYAYRAGSRSVPLTRFIDIENHLDLLANGITFNRSMARDLIAQFISRSCCGGPGGLPGESSGENDCCGTVVLPIDNLSSLSSSTAAPPSQEDSALRDVAREFFTRAMAEDLSPADVFRITTTSFMDAYNFDVRQLMKSCVHHVLPSGHIIPFSAYNVLYREGHVPLPPLALRANRQKVGKVSVP